jgi:putative methionine-R-sulfoxide reductase with GAF domain
MKKLARTLQRVAERLRPQRDAVVEEWARALVPLGSGTEDEVRADCGRSFDALLVRLSAGDVEGLLVEEARQASLDARRGKSTVVRARELRILSRCLRAHLVEPDPAPDDLESLTSVDELIMHRLEALLRAQEEESTRRLLETQEQGAQAAERAREGRRVNEALRRAESKSRHRAEQLGLLASVVRRIAPIREPGELMQQAAESIRARMDHTYVAVVVLDDAGSLVGRWSGRPGVGRESRGRAQGLPGGVIGRAIRLRAPQAVGDVSDDPDYLPDVPGTRSEMVIPLLQGAQVLGALDFQSERPYAFALDDVAAGETLADFLVIALENARLYQEARQRNHGSSS